MKATAVIFNRMKRSAVEIAPKMPSSGVLLRHRAEFPIVATRGASALLHFIMKISLAKVAILLALANTSLAHYIFQSLTVNGVTTEPFQYVRRHNNRNNPLKGFLSHEWIRCNKEAQSYAAQTSTLKIAAGSTVSFVLDIDIWHPSVSGEWMPIPLKRRCVFS